MQSDKKIFSVRWKMYIFIAITVLVVVCGTATISFFTSVNQIDTFYKHCASDNARNFASMVDGDYLARLRPVVESEEFQALRNRAEEEDNEELIEDYLKEHDLWDGYSNIRSMITGYLSNMEEIEYIYVIAHGDKDALTGVGNKAAFIKKCNEMKYRIEKEGEEFAIMMVDINNLKHVNDECGHEAGDIYIRGCCNMICDILAHSPVFRIGGDEFVAILRDYDYNNRHALTEKLKKDFMSSFSQEDKEPWLRYSAAVGMAEKTSEDNSIDSVFKRADKIMYEDKALFKQKYGSDR